MSEATTITEYDPAAQLERARAERLEQMELFDDHRFAAVDVALSGTMTLGRHIAADRELLDGLTLGAQIDATLNGYVLRFTVVGRTHRLKDTADGDVNVAKTTLRLDYFDRPRGDDANDAEAEFDAAAEF